MKIQDSRFKIQDSKFKIQKFRSKIRDSRGVALIMVLWVIAILSMIALEFSFAMRTEVNLTRHYKEEVQLYGYAAGGVQRAIAELIFKHDARIQQMRKTQKAEEAPPEKKEWVTDGRTYLLPYDQGSCEIRVMGESGKVNVNTVTEATLRKIIGQLGLEGEGKDVVTDSILDWRDADDLYRINGAENDYYQSLKEPYTCKNGNLDSIEELLLVRGVTPELFYGKKAAKKEEGEEKPAGVRIGLRDLFSLYSTGEQIDINSTTSPVLRMVVGLPIEVVRQIIKAREEKVFLNELDLVQRVPEIQPLLGEARRFLVYQSAIPFYTIECRGKGMEGGTSRGLKAVVKIDPKEKTGYKVIQWVDLLL